VVNPPNLPGWKAVPLAAILKKAFKVPVYLENDANAAAVGELKFGAAEGAKNFLYVTVSTGIGGGIVIDGKVYGGSNGSAGEIGHTIIDPTGEVCGCGRKGCFEIMASGRALVRYGKEFLGKELTPIEIEDLARQGNRQALKAIDRLVYYLAIGLGNQINTLSPELIVVGGGLSNLGPLLFRPLANYLKVFALPANLKGCKIKQAKLGQKAGVLGAIGICL
jgi:glucokinase